MKKLRIGFTALVAIVAIGLTIAAQAGVFETKVAKAAESDCFDVRFVTGLPIDVKDQPACPTAATTLDQSDVCNKEIYNGDMIFTDLSSHPVIVGNPSEVCPGDAQICCIEVQRLASPLCPNQPVFNIGSGSFAYEVKLIRCTLE